MTGRQYRAWIEYLYEPSQDQKYMMLIAQRVLQAASLKPDEVTLEGQRLVKSSKAQRQAPDLASKAREAGARVSYRGRLMSWAEYDALRRSEG